MIWHEGSHSEGRMKDLTAVSLLSTSASWSLSCLRSSVLTCHSSPYSRPEGTGVSRVNDGPEGDERRETP